VAQLIDMTGQRFGKLLALRQAGNGTEGYRKMSEHNEPGKSYEDCPRRREAAFDACDGIPTEWLERGLIKQMYSALAVIALADALKDVEGDDITFPANWWKRSVREELDKMNAIATAGKPN
jgi:hypothetical protein